MKQPEQEKLNTAGKQGKLELQAPLLMLPASHARTAQDSFAPDWTDKPSAHPPTTTPFPS